MADTKILIIVKDVEAGEAYAEALGEIGVGYDIASTFHEMASLAIENAYNGLLIDILTLVRSSKEEKVIAYECINLFPVLRVKWEAKKKKICLSPLEQAFSPDTASVLRIFAEDRCRPFKARSLRRYNRKSYFLNVLLSPDREFSEAKTLKTFTLNISPGGLFLHTVLAFEPGQQVWLRFAEYPALEPVAATVRWGLDWGMERGVPGIGLRFEALSEAQAEVIRTITNG